MLLRLNVLTEGGGVVDWKVPVPERLRAAFETRPVLTKEGDVQLLDMYVCGDWHGSRRTIEQCWRYFDYIEKLANEQARPRQ